MDGVLDWVTLSLAPGLGVSGYWNLVKYFDGPKHVLAASSKDLLAVPGVRSSQVAGLCESAALYERGEKEIAKALKFGAKVIGFADEAYPDLLRQTADPPPVVYVYGREELLNSSCLAIVGSRAATAYGRRIAFSLAERLTAASVTVVSGLAMGIDAQAHGGALSAGGNTVAVLGCGLDIVYPAQNRAMFQRIRDQGVLVSEYPFGTRPEGFRFPARNRIIAGMSLGVVVVEAAKKSGSLITAQLALDGGREVFAVPGQVDSFKSAGTHWLLKQGAKLVQTVDDILEEIQPGGCFPTTEDKPLNAADSSSLQTDAAVVFGCLDAYPCSRDELIVRSGLSASKVNEMLLLLELDGLVEILSTDEVQRLG